MDFVKNHSFFVGIDSDGTAFDSMTIKHTHSFIPAAIEVFSLHEYKDTYKEIAERINLFSLSRGVNRFPGLYDALKELEEKSSIKFEGIENFKEYLDSVSPLSNAGLEGWLKEHPSEFNLKVLEWSRLGDKFFEELTKNIPPFDNCLDAVKKMHEKADIMVVSAASYSGLLKDWSNAGLSDFVDFIAGQEFGNKASQLRYAVDHGADSSKMLMIGDATGDYKAAKQVGALFYPIIPGRETECWKKLKDTYFDMFINGCYTTETEEKLYNEFIAVLKG